MTNDNDIDLNELILALLNKKFLIASATSVAAVASIVFALWLPNIYSSQALLAPASKEDSLSAKLGSYSSFAGIAGINLPGETGSKDKEAIERVKSYDFFVDQFLPNIKFEDLVAYKRWDQRKDIIIYDNKVYDKANEKWIRKAKYPKLSKPSNQEAFKIYKEIFTATVDKKTNFVTLEFEHVSPVIAKLWLDIVIDNINLHMRDLDMQLAKNSINFLNNASNETSIAPMRDAISDLLENQMQILMLADSTTDYVFKSISSPIVTEEKIKPSRAMIVILGTFFGFIFSSLASLVLHYRNDNKS